jgi:UDP-2,4-diacetamido-2,4,6-trideoxy-beta-L-altropyranose hydrolase
VNPGTLVIRADASITMGTGHVIRCLALAQAWQDVGGDVVFAMAESTPAIARCLQDEGIEIARLECHPGSAQDASEVAALAQEYSAKWVAVDGYQFHAAYQRRIKDSGRKLLLIDDTGQCVPYCADLVLNQNAYAQPDMYRRRDPGTILLLGSHYALLREEFVPWRSWRRDFAPVAKHVLITMGGSDPQNASAGIVNALTESSLDIEITVVIGGSNPHTESWRQIARQSLGRFKLQTDVKDMAELMVAADLAISAAGSSCYELALLQVPMVLITLAENQHPTAQALSNHGAAIDAGWFHTLDPERLIQTLHALIPDSDFRRSLAQKARPLVDGNGAGRVCQFLLRNQEAQSGTFSKLQVGAV